MNQRSPLHPLPAVLLICGCGVADSQGDARTGQVQGPILGDLLFGTGCTAAQQQFLGQAAFLARTVVTSRAFSECVTQRMGAYIRCNQDPVVSGSTAAATALLAARNINSIGVACDRDMNNPNAASANNDTYLNYSDDDIFFHGWLDTQVQRIGVLSNPADDDPARAAFPEPQARTAEILVHEALHQHNYRHWDYPGLEATCQPATGLTTTTCNGTTPCTGAGQRCVIAPMQTNGVCATYDMYRHSAPYLVNSCIFDVLNRSHSNCTGGFCSTRTADDLGTCQDTGRLSLINTFDAGVGQCSTHFDPSRRSKGILRFDNSELKAVDMVPAGQFFTSSWRSGELDTFAPSAANLVPTMTGEEFIVKSAWGLGVIGFSNGRLATAALSPFGTALSHWGDGTSTWTPASSDAFLAPRRFSTQSQYGTVEAVRDEILVRSASAFGLLAVIQGTLRTRNVVASNTQIPGPFGHWTFDGSNGIQTIGDVNGDGQAEILVTSSWGKALISRNGPGGSFTVVDITPAGGAWGSWATSSSDTIVATGDFSGDSRTDILVKSGWGIGLIGMPSGQSRLTALWLAPWGTSVSGLWTLQSADSISPLAGRFFSRFRDSAIVRNGSDFGILTFSPAPSMVAGQKLTPGTTIPGTSSWVYQPTDWVLAVGDFDGDAIDSLVVKNLSSRAFSIIGGNTTSSNLRVQTMRITNCGNSDDVSCHGQLWGSWMVRETDKPLFRVRGGTSGDYLLMKGD